MEDFEVPSIGRFRPTSWADFKTYAGNLAWLLEIPAGRAQELLARIYGYADSHEVQAELKKPGDFGFVDPGAFPGSRLSEANTRALLLVAKELGLTLQTLTDRGWRARDCGLFGTPGQHRAAVRRIKQLVQAIEGDLTIDPASGVSAYATLSETKNGKVFLELTPSGAAILEALQQIFERVQESNPINQLDEVRSFIERYPQNPWALALYVHHFHSRFYQGDWSERVILQRGNARSNFDADPDIAKLMKANATTFLPIAKKAIELFDELLEGKGAQHVDRNLPTRSKAETFFYPAILYVGARVAANAGDEKLAIAWAARNLAIVDNDNFGARHLLSALYLNEGRADSAVLKLFPAPAHEGWGCLCTAASAAAYGDRKEAIKRTAKLLCYWWAPIELFAGRWAEARKSTVLNSNHDTPAHFQELYFRTKKFWAREEKAKAFFTALSADSEVRRLVLARHVANAGMYGAGYLKEEEAGARMDALHYAETELRTELPQRLASIWDRVMAA